MHKLFFGFKQFQYVLLFVTVMFTQGFRQCTYWNVTFYTVFCTHFYGMFCTLTCRSYSPQFKWHYVVIFGLIREMFPNTVFTQMYVTNVTVPRGDRGLTKVTPYGILEAEHRVIHGQVSRLLMQLQRLMLKNRNIFNTVLQTFAIGKLHIAKFYSKHEGHFGTLLADLLSQTEELEINCYYCFYHIDKIKDL